jgi:hypothetical protein
VKIAVVESPEAHLDFSSFNRPRTTVCFATRTAFSYALTLEVPHRLSQKELHRQATGLGSVVVLSKYLRGLEKSIMQVFIRSMGPDALRGLPTYPLFIYYCSDPTRAGCFVWTSGRGDFTILNSQFSRD